MLLALLVATARMRFLDNGVIRIGVDLGKGGAITYLARSHGGENLVNDFDLGRQIQMSYYSGPVPFSPGGKKPRSDWAGLGWNPIQSGDCYGHPSKTTFFSSKKNEMEVRCVPMQWPLDDVPGECEFRSVIRLNGDAVEVRNWIVNRRADRTQYPGRGQELPAVYTNGPWHHLVTYTGEHPFSNGPVAEIPKHPWGPSGPWTSFLATEHWAALLNDAGQGLGVFEPETITFSGGFAGVPGSGGPKDSPTGYIAPNFTEILDWNIRYENRYALILGGVARIRKYAAAHSPVALAAPNVIASSGSNIPNAFPGLALLSPPATSLRNKTQDTRRTAPTAPSYLFARDRRHWIYANASDSGWPIQGCLDVKLSENDPQVIGPQALWDARSNSTLVIVAAFRTHNPEAKVYWSRFDAPGFSEARSLTFRAVPNGKFETYDIDLSASPEYKGTITGLRFDPEPEGHPGDEVLVKSISFKG